jgi:hypothetical protein
VVFAYIKNLPWKKIGVSIVLGLFVLWLPFHFYIARPSRLVGVFERNIEELNVINDNLRYWDVEIQQILFQPHQLRAIFWTS